MHLTLLGRLNYPELISMGKRRSGKARGDSYSEPAGFLAAYCLHISFDHKSIIYSSWE